MALRHTDSIAIVMSQPINQPPCLFKSKKTICFFVDILLALSPHLQDLKIMDKDKKSYHQRGASSSSSQPHSKHQLQRNHRLIAQPTRSPEPQIQMRDLDLDLKSLWFAKVPAVFPPPSINSLPGKRTYSSSSGWTSSGVRKTHTFTGAIRDTTTLGTTIIHLTWDGSNPGVTVKAQQRHIPPPRKLSRSELDAYRER